MLPENFSEIEDRVKDTSVKGAAAGGAIVFLAGILTGGLAWIPLIGGGAAAAAAGGAIGKNVGVTNERERLAKPEALAHELAAADDKQVIQILMRESTPKLVEKLKDAKETTIALEELDAFLNERNKPFDALDSLFYGQTPMLITLNAINHRFKQELQNRDRTTSILFLLSDGVPTDGNPLVASTALKKSGVHIVSCYITNDNITEPRSLYNNAVPNWSDGAKLMFSIASPIESVSAFTGFLRELGWYVPENAKAFVQINHPAVLDEFIRIILAPLET